MIWDLGLAPGQDSPLLFAASLRVETFILEGLLMISYGCTLHFVFVRLPLLLLLLLLLGVVRVSHESPSYKYIISCCHAREALGGMRGKSYLVSFSAREVLSRRLGGDRLGIPGCPGDLVSARAAGSLVLLRQQRAQLLVSSTYSNSRLILFYLIIIVNRSGF